MLVLSRKPGESIHIGPSIRIKVVAVGRHTVKLGIDAPDEMRILRGELESWADPQSSHASNAELALSKHADLLEHPTIFC